MCARWMSVALLLLFLIGCEQPRIGSKKVVLPTSEAVDEAELGKQLKINREALLKGSTEQIRIDAASVMLFSESPMARRILIDVLRQAENIPARVAVCKALSQARAEQKSIENEDDFIPPLFYILTTDFDESSKFAAEAILIFDYDQISGPLEGTVTDLSLPVKARLNAIYALRLQPDMRAVFQLIDQLDNTDKQVAAGAEEALRFLGTPIGEGPEAREQIRSALKRKGRDEFFKDIIIRQESKMRELRAERDQWQERYLLALGKIYDAGGDDTAKARFLAEHLKGSEAITRLWALEKVYQDRVGTRPNPKLPDEVGPILVELIADRNKDVRLKIAKLLSLMGELNSAQRLLNQLEVEQDDEVKMELFAALGYAFLPNPKTKIPTETRKQALEWAVKYLAEQDPKKARKGAEVMKKLLEQDGLTTAEVDGYLSLLLERYKEAKDDGNLRGELLSSIAGLCAPQSVYSAHSKKRFNSLFEEALSDQTNLVREAAVDGLIHIDKATALKRLRKDFVNDPSAIVRKKLIDLAGEVGGKDDLFWLVDKIGSNAESEPGWQAMLKIFRRSEADILSEWIDRLVLRDSKSKLPDEQKISFLEMAERKAVGENKAEMLKSVREKLAGLYIKLGQYERAADYLGKLHEAAQTAREKEKILPDLLGVYLRWPRAELAAKLVENCLLEKDLDPNNVVIRSIDEYMSKPPDGADSNVVLEALGKIKTPEPRPMWQSRLKHWADLRKSKGPG